MKRFAAALLTIWMIGTLTACGGQQETPATRQIIAMDTAMTFTVYGEQGNDAVQEMVKEVQRLEQLLDRTEDDSAITRLNEAGGGKTEVGGEICGLLEKAVEFSCAADGAFDITIAPVVSAWGFTEAEFRVPQQAELTELLDRVGAEHVLTDGETAALTGGAQVDLGGIAKGYASDRMAEIFAGYGLERGWVSLGGNVLAWGSKNDGTPWKVGIQDPKDPNGETYVGMIGLENAYAVTSGGYQRYFEENGKTYHHILDPATGYPADSGLTSVTVVADSTVGNGTMCDALSTALFVMGEDGALDFWRTGVYDFELVLVTEDDRVLVTDGLAENFTQTEGSGYSYETVS